MAEQDNNQSKSACNTFVGRERELRELRAALKNAEGGRGHLFLISGEPGIGKTRLAAEFGVEAAARGIQVAWGRCWEGGGAPAYWPWVELLRSLVPEGMRARAHQIVIPPEIGHLMPELLPETVQQRPSTDPEQARFRLFDAVANLLMQLAQSSPLVLILDDLHEGDRTSLDLFKFIARGLANSRIVIIGTYRDAEVRRSKEVAEAIAEILRHGNPMPLTGLDESEVSRIIEFHAEQPPSATFASELHRVTTGNPLFVDEVVRVLLAERKLGTAEHLDLSGFKLPEGVRGAIRKRLAMLSAEAQSVLVVGAVIGQEFDTVLLRRVREMNAEALVHLMREACEVGIVAAASRESYRFTHPLIREALYRGSNDAERVQLHREIAEVLEQMYTANLTPHLATLAHHFHEAGVVDKAIEYSIRAGEAANAVFAYEAAISHFEGALAVTERHLANSSLRAELLCRLGGVETFYHDRLRGVAQLEASLELYKQAGEESKVAEIHSLLGLALAPFGPHMNVTRGLFHYQQAEVLRRSAKETPSLVLLYWGLSMANLESLRIDDALSASKRAMEMGDRVGGGVQWLRPATTHSMALAMRGRLSEASALNQEIEIRANGIADPEAYGLAMWSCAWSRRVNWDLAEAQRFYRLGLKRSGQSPQRAPSAEYLALTELLTGNIVQAKEFAAHNRTIGVLRSQIALYEGDWHSARNLLSEQVEWWRAAGSRWNEAVTLSLLLEVMRVEGDDAAEGPLARAFQLYDRTDLLVEMLVRPEAAMFFAQRGNSCEALEHLKYCRAILAQGEDWSGRAGTVWRAEAAVAAASQDFAAANEHFKTAVEIFRRYSLRWLEADSFYDWGRAMTAVGDRVGAGEKFDAAIEIFQRHGFGQRAIDRVNAARKRLPDAAVAERISVNDSALDAVFRKEGDFWAIAYGGGSFRLRDMKGLAYIAYLLAHPGERIHVCDLVAIVEGASTTDSTVIAGSDGLSRTRDLGDGVPMLDHKAKAEYSARLGELREELEEAERLNDRGRAEHIRQELQFVDDELSAAVGLGGRDRKMSDSAERARLRIGKAIRYSLSGILEHNLSLGHHFTTCIRTGYFCAYIPDPSHRQTWNQ